LLIGDSHADSVVTAIQSALPSVNDHVTEWAHSGCPTMQGVTVISRPGDRCGEFVDWVLLNLKKIPTNIPIVIVNKNADYAIGEINNGEKQIPQIYFSKIYAKSTPESIQEYSEKLIDTACTIAKNHTVYLVRPFPEMMVNIPKTRARTMIFGSPKEYTMSLKEYHQRNDFVWNAQNRASEQCGIKILDPLPYLCDATQCFSINNERSVYYDSHHLSEYGNQLLLPMFRQIFTP